EPDLLYPDETKEPDLLYPDETKKSGFIVSNPDLKYKSGSNL
ncbi:4194_t:CDS:1, partial [Funneliformis caledonium]